MPYVSRDENHKIISVFNRPQPDTEEEFLNDDNEEVVAFLMPKASLVDRLNAIYQAQPIEVQAQFITMSTGVAYFISQGNAAAARLAVQNQQVPQDLEPVKQALLEEFDR